MKLTKTLFTAAAVSAFCVGTASALTIQQCEELGGTVNLAESQCELTAAQEDEARALGWLPGSSAAAGGAATGLGTVAVGGSTAAAAAAGLALAVVIIGNGSSTTTTTTTTTN